ncbi:hypothetical protein C8R44DRAFT_736022 [Mycena epipterygia]|nr:hypothetical protein C8R44DRAFT_736022 [Mycena epipterygia]
MYRWPRYYKSSDFQLYSHGPFVRTITLLGLPHALSTAMAPKYCWRDPQGDPAINKIVLSLRASLPTRVKQHGEEFTEAVETIARKGTRVDAEEGDGAVELLVDEEVPRARMDCRVGISSGGGRLVYPRTSLTDGCEWMGVVVIRVVWAE